MTATILERIAYDAADKQAGRYVRGKTSLPPITLRLIAEKTARLFALAGCPAYADFWRSRADSETSNGASRLVARRAFESVQ